MPKRKKSLNKKEKETTTEEGKRTGLLPLIEKQERLPESSHLSNKGIRSCFD